MAARAGADIMAMTRAQAAGEAIEVGGRGTDTQAETTWRRQGRNTNAPAKRMMRPDRKASVAPQVVAEYKELSGSGRQ
jgi:hypothetical protein